MLEIRHLRIVDAISRAGTVTEAAKRVHLTQPAVSHALAELETRLGVKLFERAGRRMIATEEGLRLLVTAEKVLEEVANAEHELRRYREGVRGVIRLSTECYTCYHWLPPLLRRFHERFPDVELSLTPETSQDPLEALSTERLDVAVVFSEVRDRALLGQPLFNDELVLLVPPDHALSSRSHVEAEDFRNEVVLLHSTPEDSTLYATLLEPAGVRPRRALTMKLTEAIFASVKAGLGVTAVARWVAAPELGRGELVAVPITAAGLFRTWSVAMRRRDAQRVALRQLVEMMKAGPFPSDTGRAACMATAT